MRPHLRTELVLEALDMALEQRRPSTVIHHSDQGTQYTSIAFGQRCEVAGVGPSTGSVGDCYDNAMCESFFATLECELIDPSSVLDRKPGALCSNSSKASTIGIVAIRRWVSGVRCNSNMKRLSIVEKLRKTCGKSCLPEPELLRLI